MYNLFRKNWVLTFPKIQLTSPRNKLYTSFDKRLSIFFSVSLVFYCRRLVGTKISNRQRDRALWWSLSRWFTREEDFTFDREFDLGEVACRRKKLAGYRIEEEEAEEWSSRLILNEKKLRNLQQSRHTCTMQFPPEMLWQHENAVNVIIFSFFTESPFVAEKKLGEPTRR